MELVTKAHGENFLSRDLSLITSIQLFLTGQSTPKMTGTYSIAEVIDDSNKRPDKTVFCILEFDDIDRFRRWFSEMGGKFLHLLMPRLNILIGTAMK